MEFKKDLELTIKVCGAKIEDLMAGRGTDLDYIRDMETLVRLRSAAEDKMDKAI